MHVDAVEIAEVGEQSPTGEELVSLTTKVYTSDGSRINLVWLDSATYTPELSEQISQKFLEIMDLLDFETTREPA